MHKTKYRFLLIVPILVFLGLFYLYPLANIFYAGVKADNLWNLSGFFSPTARFYLNKFGFTLFQAVISTLLTLIVAAPSIYVFVKYRFPGKQILQAIMTMPFVMPTVVVAAAFIALFGNDGICNQILMKMFGLSSPVIRLENKMIFFIIAQVFYNSSIIFHIVKRAWQSLPTNLSEAAYSLGCSKWKNFWKVTLPLLAPSIITSTIIIFTLCFICFGIILVLVGDNFSTLSIEIFRQAILFSNLSAASILAIIQMTFSFGVFLILGYMQRKTTHRVNTIGSVKERAKHPKKLKDKLAVILNVIFILCFFGAPLTSLVLRSFSTENGLSISYYTGLFEDKSSSMFAVPPIESILNSISVALMTILISVTLGLLTSTYLEKVKKRTSTFIDSVLMLPFVTSAAILGLGFIVMTSKIPWHFRDSMLFISIMHSLMAFPFVMRCLVPALKMVPTEVRESAALLGASPRKVWGKIDLPMIEKVLAVSAAFAFILSIGEFGASSFMAKPNTPLITTSIASLLTSDSIEQQGQGVAMSSLLMFITIFGAGILMKIRAQKNIKKIS